MTVTAVNKDRSFLNNGSLRMSEIRRDFTIIHILNQMNRERIKPAKALNNAAAVTDSHI